jgi:hypothetical protein
MKITFLLYTTFFLASCSSSEIETSRLWGKWTLEGGDPVSTTEFRPDGVVYIEYEEGPDLEGTWSVSEGGNLSVSIRDWELVGQIEDSKLLLRNGDNVRSYSRVVE